MPDLKKVHLDLRPRHSSCHCCRRPLPETHLPQVSENLPQVSKKKYLLQVSKSVGEEKRFYPSWPPCTGIRSYQCCEMTIMMTMMTMMTVMMTMMTVISIWLWSWSYLSWPPCAGSRASPCCETDSCEKYRGGALTSPRGSPLEQVPFFTLLDLLSFWGLLNFFLGHITKFLMLFWAVSITELLVPSLSHSKPYHIIEGLEYAKPYHII